ncbi:MAG: hypothetical protein ACRDZ2_13420 [Ilumatobacteraceae bacterium]
MRRSVVVALAGVVVVVTAVGAACARDEPDTGPEPTVAVIQVVDETYRIELATPELVDQARQLLGGEGTANIPIGKIDRSSPSVNEPWSWHIDPATIEFVEITMEVCDGLPSFVEDGSLTSEFYCPWDATVIAIEAPEA